MDSWESMVARDCTGKCIWWSKKRIVGRPKPANGEAMAILLGLQAAISRGWRKVIMESDCLQIITCLSNLSSSLASFGALIDACLELRVYFQTISFSFVR